MRRFKEYPDEDEYVMATVTGINPNSAFVVLDEYNNRTGMVHVSEVANTWVKDIRQFLNVGQKLVLKVVAIDSTKGHINLSLKRVKPSARRDKTAEFKNEKKAESLLKFVQKELQLNDKERESLEYKLQEKFSHLYPLFELGAQENGEESLVAEGVSAEWAKAISAVAKKNIKTKEVEIKGILTLKSYSSDGLELIKKALAEAADHENVDIKYISAPQYQVTITGPDYPVVEKILSSTVDEVIALLKKSQGEAEFARIEQ
jgi:translation initiation factor 2 subunit 1